MMRICQLLIIKPFLNMSVITMDVMDSIKISRGDTHRMLTNQSLSLTYGIPSLPMMK